jgi:cysteine-rich repeat protein
MVVARTLFQGDAGNSIKSSAHSNYVENNLILGNCAYFKNQSFTAMNKEQTGRSGTACNYDGTCQATENNTNCHWNDSNGNGGIDPGEGDCAGFNNCRANGDTVTFNIRVPNQTAILTGNTIYGNSNILLFVEGTADVCGSLTLRSRNNIYVGGIEHNDGADFPDFFYSQGPGTCNNINLNTDYDIIYHTNHIATDCTDTGNGGHNTCTNTDPGFVGPVPIGTNYFTGSNFDQSFYLLSTSIARGATKADETVTCADNCAVDYNGYSRGAQWDAGALQYGSVPTGATCSTSCSLCLTQGTCAASPITCYWWTDSSCHSSQEPEVCGNGITVSPETCDDGNTTDGDCCSSICETETSGLERFLQTSRWTESDPSSHLTVTTHKVVVSGQDRNSSTSLVYDGGASHFGDFTTRMKVDWTNCTSTTCTLAVWALSSTLRSNLSAMQSASDGVFLALYQQPAGGTPPNSYVWYVQDATNAGNYAGFADSTPPVSRYVQITRSGTTVTVSVYTDSSYTTLVTASGNPIVLTVPATAYRYLYTAMSRNDGFTDAQINATIQDLNIGESTLSCGSGGAVCGNSTCETGETSINCPADCTTPQTTSQTGGFAGKGKLTGNGRAK